jgi:hypothetical protein
MKSIKYLGDITAAEVKAEGYKSMSAFVDAWLDVFGYWDPSEPLEIFRREMIA